MNIFAISSLQLWCIKLNFIADTAVIITSSAFMKVNPFKISQMIWENQISNSNFFSRYSNKKYSNKNKIFTVFYFTVKFNIRLRVFFTGEWSHWSSLSHLTVLKLFFNLQISKFHTWTFFSGFMSDKFIQEAIFLDQNAIDTV